MALNLQKTLTPAPVPNDNIPAYLTISCVVKYTAIHIRDVPTNQICQPGGLSPRQTHYQANLT